MNAQVLDIIIKKIEKDYAGDIAFLALYNTKCNKGDQLGLDFYFVPKTEKAHMLSTQFIIDGVSYDLFPMSWQRLVSIAAMDSPQAYLILEAEIVYSSDEEAINRFNHLKADLKTVLNGSYHEALINKSFEYLNETYIYLYNILEMSQTMMDIKLESSKIIKQIANALAFANDTTFKGGQGSEVCIIEDSFSLNNLPDTYEKTVNSIIYSSSKDEIIEAVKLLIKNTRQFLENEKLQLAQIEPFETFFKGYFEELKGIINLFRIAINEKQYTKQFALASYMHEEVAQFMQKSETGKWFDDRNTLNEYNGWFNRYFDVDFLSLITNRDDDAIESALNIFEEQMIALMTEHDIQLLSFETIDGFNTFFQTK